MIIGVYFNKDRPEETHLNFLGKFRKYMLMFPKLDVNSHTPNRKGGGKMPAAITKQCQRCGQEKPLSDFFHNMTKSDKHNGICKACQSEVNKK